MEKTGCLNGFVYTTVSTSLYPTSISLGMQHLIGSTLFAKIKRDTHQTENILIILPEAPV